METKEMCSDTAVKNRLNSITKFIIAWWLSEQKLIAWIGIISIILICILSVYINVIITNWNKDLYNAIGNKNIHDFFHLLSLFVPLVIFRCIESASRSYLLSWYSFKWRLWSTNKLMNQWLASKNYYLIAQNQSFIDNPDQRIASDINLLTDTSISLFELILRNTINLVTFGIILWQISSSIIFSFNNYIIKIPGFLVWTSFIYCGLGLLITKKTSSPLVKLNRDQEKYEANFRFSLMRIFERREEIATLSGEGIEKKNLNQAIKNIITNFYLILNKVIHINIFINLYGSLSEIVTLVLAAPSYFSGKITLGIMMQAHLAFRQVNDSVFAIIEKFNLIAGLMASLQRIVDFEEQIINQNLSKNRIDLYKEKSKTNISKDSSKEIAKQSPSEINLSSKSNIELENYKLNIKIEDRIFIPKLDSITTSQDNMLQSPEIEVNKGEIIELSGPSGCGKTTLLRILSGLQELNSEAIEELNNKIILPSEIMFIPQKNYMPKSSSLRQCICYPSEDFKDEEIIDNMQSCNLKHLINYLEDIKDYQNILSLGEQQRINFVRVFLHKPQWLIMDEPFSNLNQENIENLCYLLKKNLPNSGILIISHTSLPKADRTYFFSVKLI